VLKLAQNVNGSRDCAEQAFKGIPQRCRSERLLQRWQPAHEDCFPRIYRRNFHHRMGVGRISSLANSIQY
jgi:hypothetical protein